MDIYSKIERVGYLCGKLNVNVEFNGKSFTIDNEEVATIDTIDQFISYLEQELTNNQ